MLAPDEAVGKARDGNQAALQLVVALRIGALTRAGMRTGSWDSLVPSQPLSRQLRPVSPMILDQGSLILVRPRYHAAVELGAGNARAHRQGRGDPREEHQRAAEDD
jgi:hypothetical protein